MEAGILVLGTVSVGLIEMMGSARQGSAWWTMVGWLGFGCRFWMLGFGPFFLYLGLGEWEVEGVLWFQLELGRAGGSGVDYGFCGLWM